MKRINFKMFSIENIYGLGLNVEFQQHNVNGTESLSLKTQTLLNSTNINFNDKLNLTDINLISEYFGVNSFHELNNISDLKLLSIVNFIMSVRNFAYHSDSGLYHKYDDDALHMRLTEVMKLGMFSFDSQFYPNSTFNSSLFMRNEFLKLIVDRFDSLTILNKTTKILNHACNLFTQDFHKFTEEHNKRFVRRTEITQSLALVNIYEDPMNIQHVNDTYQLMMMIDMLDEPSTIINHKDKSLVVTNSINESFNFEQSKYVELNERLKPEEDHVEYYRKHELFKLIHDPFLNTEHNIPLEIRSNLNQEDPEIYFIVNPAGKFLGGLYIKVGTIGNQINSVTLPNGKVFDKTTGFDIDKQQNKMYNISVNKILKTIHCYINSYDYNESINKWKTYVDYDVLDFVKHNISDRIFLRNIE